MENYSNGGRKNMIIINRKNGTVTVISTDQFHYVEMKADSILFQKRDGYYVDLLVNRGLEQSIIVIQDSTDVLFIDDREWQKRYETDIWKVGWVSYAFRNDNYDRPV